METLKLGSWKSIYGVDHEGFWVRFHRYNEFLRWILTDAGWIKVHPNDTFSIGDQVYTISEENAKELYEILKKHFDVQTQNGD